MRTVNFLDGLLKPIAYQLGIDPEPDFNKDHAAAWTSFINSRITDAWDFWDWAELTVAEERAFRTIWNSTRQVKSGDEIFYIPTLSYYTAIATPPIGTLPTNVTYYAALTMNDPYIALDQVGRRPIDKVIGIYFGNPNGLNGDGMQGLWFKPSSRGIDVANYAGPTAFLKYRITPSQFTTRAYDATKQYHATDIVYWTDGDCYQAVNDVLGVAPPAAIYWRKVPVPTFLVEYLKFMVAADAADDAQTAAGWRQDGEDSLIRQVNKLIEQGDTRYYSVRKPWPARGWWPLGVGGFWWSVSPPWTSTTVSTLSDVDDFPGPIDTVVQVREAVYLPSVDALRGPPNGLNQIDFTGFAIGSLIKIKITVGGVLATQEFSIEAGAVDGTDPTGSVEMAGESTRHLQKVGGY